MQQTNREKSSFCRQLPVRQTLNARMFTRHYVYIIKLYFNLSIILYHAHRKRYTAVQFPHNPVQFRAIHRQKGCRVRGLSKHPLEMRGRGGGKTAGHSRQPLGQRL